METEKLIGVFEDCFHLLRSPPNSSGDYRTEFIRVLFRHPEQWIRREIIEYHGFDVLRSSDLDRPYVTFENKNGRLIFYRYEDFRENALGILGEALGRKPRRLVSKNIGKKKMYGPLYGAFRGTYCPSQEIWDYYYRSEYFERLYSGRAPRYAPR